MSIYDIDVCDETATLKTRKRIKPTYQHTNNSLFEYWAREFNGIFKF
jgi:hypothetical protein